MNTADIIIYIIDISLIGLIILLVYFFFSRKSKKKEDKIVENKEIEKKEYKIILDSTGKMNLEEIESAKISETPKIFHSNNPSDIAENSIIKNNPDILNMNNLQTELKKADDENYEKMVKVSAFEISHAHEIDKQQLQIQEEREKRRRLIS
jgi:DNA replication protein DnaD